MSFAQSLPKASHASTSTGRWPRSDHNANSTAPVSEAGTIPILNSPGIPRNSRVASIASAILDFGPFARCERPSAAAERFPRCQPGGLEQGPDEKQGLLGRLDGLMNFAMVSFQICASRWGEVTRRGSYWELRYGARDEFGLERHYDLRRPSPS